MNTYDVHIFGQVRIKIPAVQAATHLDAARIAGEDEEVLQAASLLIDRHDMAGRIEALEYQAGSPPGSYLVDMHGDDDVDVLSRTFFENEAGDLVDTLDDPVPNHAQDEVLLHLDSGANAAQASRFRGSREISAYLRRQGNRFASAVFDELAPAQDSLGAMAILQRMADELEAVRAAVAKHASSEMSGSAHHEEVVRTFPQILPLFDQHQLVATFVAAEDESVDPSIDVSLAGRSEDLGGIQIAGDGYVAGAWTSPAQEAMAHGPWRTRIEDAARDLVGLLEKHHRIAAR